MKKASEDGRRGEERKLSPMEEQIILALKVYFFNSHKGNNNEVNAEVTTVIH